jgi:glycosyltransferase involved in cell wall biosynthesis
MAFLGFVSDEEKRALLGSAWVFAMPSRTEGYGIAAIEANAAGTFVIGNDVEGLREAIHTDESGMLVDCSDSESFSHTLIEWLDRAKLGGKEKTARAWARLHSWDASAEMLRALLMRSGNRRA